MSISEQISAALDVLADSTNPAGIGEDATHTTANGQTETSDLRLTVHRRTVEEAGQLFGMDGAEQTAEASAIAADWPTVQDKDRIELSDGNWRVKGDPVAVHGLIIMDLARRRTR